MLKKIIGTIATRFIIAVFILAIIIINARVLGPEKVGTISLLMLAITIIQLLNNFIGGGALVYLVPRIELLKLIIPSYCWSVLTAFTGTGILSMISWISTGFGCHVQLIPEGYTIHVLLLSLLLSLASVNFMVLMGKEKIRSYNLISVIQMIWLFGTLMVSFYIFGNREVSSYLISLYVSYSFALVCSFFLILPEMARTTSGGIKDALKEIFRLGSIMQLGNILQFLNYRVSYYFIEFFLNRAAVGIYSVGVQLSESIWLSSKSISLVQYTRISNEKDPGYAARLTLNLLKVAFLLTLISLILILILIHIFFPLILKPEFGDVPAIMLILSAGILIFSISIILSPYFSGTGKPIHNTIGSAIGLVMTLTFSIFLIPRMGLMGAAWAATLSYCLTALYQVIIFTKITKVTPVDFLLRKKDLLTIIEEVKKFLKQ